MVERSARVPKQPHVNTERAAAVAKPKRAKEAASKPEAESKVWNKEGVQGWYFKWPVDNLGRDPEDIEPDTKWLDIMESGDLSSLRADILETFEVIASEEEAEKNVTIGMAVDTTSRLLREVGRFRDK